MSLPHTPNPGRSHDPIMDDQSSTETVIMAALSTLTPPRLADLTHSISSLFHRHRHRLSSLLSSPILFSLTLHQLHSLSLHHKSLLIARHLLSILAHFIHRLDAKAALLSCATTVPRLRDLDSVLLLLLLCELRQHDPEALEGPPAKWRGILCHYVSDTMLTLSGLEVSSDAVWYEYIEMVAKCRRFVRVMGCGGGGGKEGKEVAASVAAVVALASVEVSGGGRECVICTEGLGEGRDVCELPCEHLFHWMCILPWLRKRNTCPCCRFQLPTDDVGGEIERLWEVLVKMGRGGK